MPNTTPVAPPLPRKDLGHDYHRHGGHRNQERQLRANPLVKGLGKDNYSGGRLRGLTDMYDLGERRSAPDFRYSREFKEYRSSVEDVVLTAGADGVTIRELHTRLGDHARPRWTQDALESLSTVEERVAYISRWQPTNI